MVDANAARAVAGRICEMGGALAPAAKEYLGSARIRRSTGGLAPRAECGGRVLARGLALMEARFSRCESFMVHELCAQAAAVEGIGAGV